MNSVNFSKTTCHDELILCVPKGWDTYVSCEFSEIHSELCRHGWCKIVIDDLEDDNLLNTIKKARIVLLWEGYELLERHERVLFSISAEKIFFCDDPHFFTSHRRKQRLRAFQWADKLLATYPEKVKEWFPEIKHSKIHWTPHAAASCFYPTFNPSKKHVLLSGSRTWPYPFRQFCQAKLPTDLCDVVDHPGYPGYPGDIANKSVANEIALKHLGRESYASLLRSYPAMLVCGSIFSYLVAKVFEGMASGCLVICDRSSLSYSLSLLGFFAGEHYIETDIFHVQEDAESVLDFYLDKTNFRWDNIVKKAADKVQSEHTTAVRAAQMHAICTTKRD